jgi:hypothetical protein
MLADSPDFFQAFSFAFHHNKESVRIPDQVTMSSGFTHSLLAGGGELSYQSAIKTERKDRRKIMPELLCKKKISFIETSQDKLCIRDNSLHVKIRPSFFPGPRKT